jgi:hypothetical protein
MSQSPRHWTVHSAILGYKIPLTTCVQQQAKFVWYVSDYIHYVLSKVADVRKAEGA